MHDLLGRLQTAAELELATIPAYLVALFSIKRPSNRAVAENIRSVVIEEMLHLTLVANLMSSLGGRTCITKDRVPTYPLRLTFKGHGFADRDFDVHLAPLTLEVVKTFMAIEQPRAPRLMNNRFTRGHITISESTIGEFYDRIGELLEELHAEMGQGMFVGDTSVQISEGYYWSSGGKPIVVKDLVTAKAALRIIVEQGEATPGSLNDGDQAVFAQPYEVAHFYRFKEICHARRYAPGDDPSQLPTGDAMDVRYDAVYPVKVDAKHAEYAGSPELEKVSYAFNRQYALMLTQLEEALNGNPKVLYTSVMNGMHAVSELGLALVAMPLPGDNQGRNGCPTFEWTDA